MIRNTTISEQTLVETYRFSFVSTKKVCLLQIIIQVTPATSLLKQTCIYPVFRFRCISL